MVDQKEGTAYAHHRIDGYRIYVANGYEVDPTSVGAGTTPRLGSVAASGFPGTGENYDAAVYLGKYVYTPAGIGPTGFVSGSDALDKRSLMMLKPNVSAKVGNNLDANTLTSSYVAGMMATLQEHIGAVGDGIVTPKNAHGEAIQNVTGGGTDTLQREAFDDGIIDEAATTNNPRSANVAAAVDNVGMTTIVGDVIFADVVGGADTTKTYVSPTFAANVYIPQGVGGQLIAGQEIYLGGERLNQIRPLKPLTTSAYVGFSAAVDAVTGVYKIFGRTYDPTTNPGQMLLGKVLNTTALLPTDMEFGRVLWNGSTLSSDIGSVVAGVLDTRNFGIISKPQISTRGMGDPNVGMLAAQTFVNIAANGDFTLEGPNTQLPWTSIPLAWNANSSVASGLYTAGSGITGEFVGRDLITGTADLATVRTSGPQATNGLRLTFGCNVSSHFLYRRYRTSLGPLKRNTLYTVSAWIESNSDVNNHMSIGAQFCSDTSAIAYSDGVQYFVFDRTNNTTYQRIGATIRTNANPSVATPDAMLELVFEKKTGVLPNALSIKIAKVVVVEGEWSVGPIGPRVYPGEIFMWDQGTSCPPGSVEVTSMQGRMPIGNTPTLPTLSSGGALRGFHNATQNIIDIDWSGATFIKAANRGVMRVDNEYIGFNGVNFSGGTYHLTNCVRGMFGSAPATHNNLAPTLMYQNGYTMGQPSQTGEGVTSDSVSRLGWVWVSTTLVNGVTPTSSNNWVAGPVPLNHSLAQTLVLFCRRL
jgi:hypothetical protein